ncbi:hypothetical protein AS86_6411 (plasmid) [Bacillus thuringiensis HD1002]|uniref:Uncharacterized protein n=1 Tax=Bacillus thuringiensis TaxID=1428 RepID=A0AB33ARH6_BACTU|nr:hypothetical protein BF38_5946 [Bacillus thuringiensis]AJH02798.1 hypothetical protein AS86_6411 [Bacillus thuringiensis HD1002]UWX39154.1 hypothetical protein [Bacillus thuringiensis]
MFHIIFIITLLFLFTDINYRKKDKDFSLKVTFKIENVKKKFLFFNKLSNQKDKTM